jgi:chaperonin GroEL
MSASVVRFGDDARRPTTAGVDILADLVARTIGPGGRAVLVGRRHAAPKLLRNGYAIAAALELDDLAQQTGVVMLRELAWRTSDAVGDGTSSAVLVARALLRAGQRATSAGMPAVELVGLVEAHTDAILGALQAAAEELPNGEALARFAGQAAGGDAELGGLLAEAHQAAGADGVVVIEEGRGAADTHRFDAGLHFDQGWLSPQLVDDQRTQSIELDDPLVLLHAGPITALEPMVRVLQLIAEAKRSLLVIADSLADQALATLVANKRRAGLHVAAVKAPGVGPWRRLMLEDLAIATGATLIAADLGNSLEGLRPQVMGRAAKVRIGRVGTTIVGGRGDAAAVAERCRDIRQAIASEQHLSFDREQHQKRLARFTSGVATLSIGGPTPSHLQQRLEQARGASAALSAARKAGLVAGGSAALVHAAERARPVLPRGLAGEALGRMIKAATEAPLRAIIRNAGGDADLMAPRVAAQPTHTFDVHYRDLVPLETLRDPLLVVQTSFRNATSIASRLLTVDCALGSLRRQRLEG